MIKKIIALFYAFIGLFRKKYLATIKDENLEKKYLNAGADFGDAVSMIYMGECIGFEDLLNKWAELEREYANRGFRTVTLDEFVSYGGYGQEIKTLGQPRLENEKPIFHAELYRKHFLGKMALINGPSPVEECFRTGKAVTGTYMVPSTKDLE